MFGLSVFSFLIAVLIRNTVSGDEATQNHFSAASCDFAIDLLKSQSQSVEGNVVLSPSSIGVLLAILQQGAQENSLKQLEEALHLTAEQSRDGHKHVLKSFQRQKVNVTLEWGNRAYIRPGFELADNFNATIQESFQAAIEELNFVEPSPQEAANAINNWVREVTHDNIKEFVPASVLTQDTVLLLLNAVYFKGLWDVPFPKGLTRQDTFELSPDNKVNVSFMVQKERFTAGEDPESGIMWVDLPFKDEQFSMLFILPLEKHGLNQVMEKMTGTLLRKIIDDGQSRQVTLRIPKFKLNEKVLLAGPLKKLGITDIFTADANLHGITPNYKNLRVSKIIHQASLEIDEDGSTASAATGVFIEVFSFPKASDQLIFTADHPFLFFILDRTNKIPLFSGRMADPS